MKYQAYIYSKEIRVQILIIGLVSCASGAAGAASKSGAESVDGNRRNRMSNQQTPSRTISRRTFVKQSVKGSAVLAALGSAASPSRALAREGSELTNIPAWQIAKLISEKKVKSVEVIGAFIQRIREVNPHINAVTHINEEGAIAQAKEADKMLLASKRPERIGVFHGVPITVKDLYYTEGLPTTGGTPGKRTFIPTNDNVAVARLRQEGAIVIGKTNVPELGLGWECDNLVFGRTSHPKDPSRTAGGSSGGEAAIIAAKGSVLGIGGDGGGSLRIPAHFAGITSIKPTWGRVPSTGGFVAAGPSEGFLFVQTGPLGRYVRDLDLALQAMSGPDDVDPYTFPFPHRDYRKVDVRGLRVAFYTDNNSVQPDLEIKEGVELAAKRLSSLGSRVSEARPATIDKSFDIYFSLIAPRFTEAMNTALKNFGSGRPSEYLRRSCQVVSDFEKSDRCIPFQEARGLRFGLQTDLRIFMKDYDVVLSPPHPHPAMKHGTTLNSVEDFGYAMTHNLSGFPSAVVRVGETAQGLPIGVEIAAKPGREDLIFAVAEYFEKN